MHSPEGKPPSPRFAWTSGRGDSRPITTVFLLTTTPATRPWSVRHKMLAWLEGFRVS